jgi:hypothetical protein
LTWEGCTGILVVQANRQFNPVKRNQAMHTLSTIITPFVVKSTLSAVALALLIGGVQQASLSFQAFANTDHARQATYVELASTTK